MIVCLIAKSFFDINALFEILGPLAADKIVQNVSIKIKSVKLGVVVVRCML